MLPAAPVTSDIWLSARTLLHGFGWALLLVLFVTGCGNLYIEPPRGLYGDRTCGTCDRENGKYGP